MRQVPLCKLREVCLRHQGNELLNHLRELPAFGCLFSQFTDGVIGSESRFIGPLRRQRIIDVHYAKDSRQQRDALAFELVRISGSIGALMMVTNDWPNIIKQSQLTAQSVANHRVLLHLGVL